jgi:DNA-binding phage protein
MNEQLQQVLARLKKARLQRGQLARIAEDSGVTSRTIYNLMHKDCRPNLATLDKLLAYFKKADRKAKRLDDEQKGSS